MVDAIYKFLGTVPLEDHDDEDSIGKGTTWLELFIAFDTGGFNPQQTKQAAVDQLKKQQDDPRESHRQQLWINHRLKHRAAVRRGLNKPLATAVQKRDLAIELDNFIRVCKFVVKDCGSSDAVSIFSPKQDGYQGNLTRLAVEGSLPTIRGRMHLSTEQATQVAASIMMQRVGQTGKQNTACRAFPKPSLASS